MTTKQRRAFKMHFHINGTNQMNARIYRDSRRITAKKNKMFTSSERAKIITSTTFSFSFYLSGLLLQVRLGPLGITHGIS